MSPSSHSCGGTDAEEAQPVSQHLSGGIIQGQPGVVHRLDWVISLRGDPGRVIQPVIHRSDFFEVAGNPVRFPQLRCLHNNAGEVRK